MEGARRKARVFVVEAIVRKTYSALNNGKKQRLSQRGWIQSYVLAIIVHVGINNAYREGKTVIVRK